MVGSIVPSHVLTAMGRAPEVAQATVRFSLGKWTTSEEIEANHRRAAGASWPGSSDDRRHSA